MLEDMGTPAASTPVSYPAVMEQRYRTRLPAALGDLSGPAMMLRVYRNLRRYSVQKGKLDRAEIRDEGDMEVN
jgi:hypothetical protein